MLIIIIFFLLKKINLKNLKKYPSKGERANPHHEHGEDIVDEWHLSLFFGVFILSLSFPFSSHSRVVSLCLREKALFPLLLTLSLNN